MQQQKQIFSTPVDMDKLFKIADHDHDGVINIEDAKLFLAGAFITVASLNAIWSITVARNGLSVLTREHFPAALALVSLAQEGRQLSPDSLAGITRPLAAPLFLAVSASDYASFEATFAQNADRATGFVSGAKALDLFSHHSLDRSVLSRIWDLSDIDKDGRLSKPEFIAMMALANRASKGLDLPQFLPSTFVDSILNPPPIPAVQTPTPVPVSAPAPTMPSTGNDFLSGLSTSPITSSSSLLSGIDPVQPITTPTTTTTTNTSTTITSTMIPPSTSTIPSQGFGAPMQDAAIVKQRRKELEELENSLAAEKAEESKVDAELALEQQRETEIVRRMKALDAETGREQERAAKANERLLALQQQGLALAQQKDALEKTLRESKEREAAAATEIAQVEQQLQRSNAEMAALEKESEAIFAQISETRRRQEELAAKQEHDRENFTNALDAIVAHRKALNDDREKVARSEMARRAALGAENIFPKSRIFGPDFVASADHRENPFDTSDMVVTGPNLWCYEPFNPEAK